MVPNFVGLRLPRRDKGDCEYYCMTMLVCLDHGIQERSEDTSEVARVSEVRASKVERELARLLSLGDIEFHPDFLRYRCLHGEVLVRSNAFNRLVHRQGPRIAKESGLRGGRVRLEVEVGDDTVGGRGTTQCLGGFTSAPIAGKLQ